MEKDNLDFLLYFQRILFEDSSDPPKEANIQRRYLAQMYQASVKTLDNASTCAFLEQHLKKLSRIVDKENNTMHQKMQEKLANLNIKTPVDLKSSINNVNLTDLMTPLPCSSNTVSLCCEKSESYSDAEYHEFMSIIKQKSSINMLQMQPRHSKETSNLSRVSSFKARGNSFDISDMVNSRHHKSEETSAKNYTSTFKTAADELQVQNMKKFVNQGQAPVGGQKRKLGTRRNLNSKFVSPLLSNPGSEEISNKSEEWPNGIDECLKNIEPKMVELIKSEIMDCGTRVDWKDIAGLDFAKTAIQEAVVWPMLRPDIFTGLRRPPKGILLFGPPGTGKTLIGKCVASQSKSTFFSISASSLTSKWVGDGEKMVRALFAVARCHQPAVIFIDEIDSLLSQRSDTEHESSRRIKTEFLVQLDGATTESEERLLLIGATNRPQELDEAARRRFVKRLYIPLPDYEARLQLTRKLISTEKHCLTEENLVEITRLSDGYSGADIRTLCAEASLGPIRSLDFNAIQNIQVAEVRPLMMEDFQKALSRVRSSVSPKDLDQYLVWNNTYGSGSFLQ